eukprot:1144162-Pelagomonas_calceolata.AAC.1
MVMNSVQHDYLDGKGASRALRSLALRKLLTAMSQSIRTLAESCVTALRSLAHNLPVPLMSAYLYFPTGE